MVYKYFEHQADIGIIGTGRTLGQAFEEGAKAMFGVMCSIKDVAPKKKAEIKAEADDEGALFIEWLNELLAQKDINNMMFSKFKVNIKRAGNKFCLAGEAWGEKTDTKKHKLKVEVKAATYSQLKIKKENNKYFAKCVVDV